MFNEQDYIRLLKQLSDMKRNALVLYYDEDDYRDSALLKAIETEVHACLVRHGKQYVSLTNHALSPELVYAFSEGKRIYAVDGEALKNSLTENDSDVYDAFIKRIEREAAYADFRNRSGLEYGSEDLISTTVVWAPEVIPEGREEEEPEAEEPVNEEPSAPQAPRKEEEPQKAEEPPKQEPEAEPEAAPAPAPAPEPAPTPAPEPAPAADTQQNMTFSEFLTKVQEAGTADTPSEAAAPEPKNGDGTEPDEEDAYESDEDFEARIMTSLSNGTAEVVKDESPVPEPEDEPVEVDITKNYEDCSVIEKNEIMQYYAAFILQINDQVGKYELMAAPLDPHHPTGKCVFWVKKWQSQGRAYVTVSESTEDHREQGTYRFMSMKSGLYMTMTPEYHDGKFSVRMSLSDEGKATLRVHSDKTIGNGGHILLTDKSTDTAIHAFPFDMKNNTEGNAGYFCVVESPEGRTALQHEDGAGVITTIDGSYQLTLRWNEETLYALFT